jgi:hypothetical protein
MKRITTILGAFFIASVVLTSCDRHGIDAAAKAEWKCECDASKETYEEKRILAEKECNELRKHNSSQFDMMGEDYFQKYINAKKELEGKSCD